MKSICYHTGKVSFETKSAAMRALVTIRRSVRRKGSDGKRIKHRCKKPRQKRAYFCVYCNGYHLTSWTWWFLYSLKYRMTLFTTQINN